MDDLRLVLPNWILSMENKYGFKTPSVLEYIMCYMVYLVLAGLTVWFSLQVRTNLISMPLAFAGLDNRMVRLLDNVSLIVVGFIVLMVIILMEHLLRTRLKRNKFWPLVARIVAIEAIVIAFSYVANFMLMKFILHT